MASSSLPPPATRTAAAATSKFSFEDINERHRHERRSKKNRKSMTNFCEFLSKLTPDQIYESDWSNFVLRLQAWLENKRLRRGVLLAVGSMLRGGAHAMFQSKFLSWIIDVKGFLEPSSEFEVKEAALKASFGFMLYAANPDNGQQLQDLLSHVTSTTFFEDGINSHRRSEWLGEAVLEGLIGLARMKPGFLKEQIHIVIRLVSEILDNPLYQERTKFLAQEFVVTLAEEGSGFGQSVLRSVESKFIESTLKQFLIMLEPIDENAKGVMISRGAEYLIRLSSLGAIYLLQTFPETFAAVTSTQWKSRFAAVTSLSLLAKNNSQELKQKLDLVAEPALKATGDDHPLVRQAAINAMDEFSGLLGPEFQLRYHGKVLPVLTKAMTDFENLDNRVMAIAAMSSFSRNCSSDVLTPYKDQIISQLLKCLEDDKESITGEALCALAAIARSLENQMQEFYGTVIPYLKVLRMQFTAGQNYNLLAATIYCITTIWMAIGKDKIGNDINMVVDALISSDGSNLEWGHPLRVQVLVAWGTLCKCLGQDFLRYMSAAIPRLLHSARLEEYVSLDEHSSPSVNEKVLEEKALACNVLCSCVAELKDGFDLWVVEVAEAVVPLLGFKYISGMPAILKLLKAMVDKNQLKQSSLENLCSNIASILLRDLDKFSIEFYPFHLDLMEECVEMAGPILNADQIRHFLDLTVEVLKAAASISGSKECIDQGKRASEKLGHSFITIIKTHKALSSLFFDYLQSLISQMWGRDNTVIERKITLQMFNGIAEQFQGEAIKYFECNLPVLFEACKDQNSEVLQVAAQAMGYSAEFGGDIFVRYFKVAIEGVSAIFSTSANREDLKDIDLEELRGYRNAYDAAVSAIIKMCLFQLDSVIATEALDLLVGLLPIKNNLEEAKVTHEMFCSLVSKLNERSICQDEANLGRIVTALSEILWGEAYLATEETVRRVIELLKDFRSRLPSSTWESILSSLPPSRQKLLENYLS